MILISSFYNEQYLLPWWLRHHKKIFDHGVLVNYYSDDESVDIIKNICSDWEIRDTRNEDWSFKDNDREFMDIEKEFDDYKAVLTTTEFLVLRGQEFPKHELKCFSVPIVRMIDVDCIPPEPDEALLCQKKFGYLDTSGMRRFVHNYPCGKYEVGRHKTSLHKEESKMLVFKYTFSPWTEEFIQRKLRMKDHIRKSEVKKGWGAHHMMSRGQLERQRRRELTNDCKFFSKEVQQ